MGWLTASHQLSPCCALVNDHDHVRRFVRHFTHGLRPEMLGLVGQRWLDALYLDAEAAIESSGGELTYQVRIVATTRGAAKRPVTEHLVEVRAAGSRAAQLVACAMAAGCDDDWMPLTIETVTDSTLAVL